MKRSTVVVVALMLALAGTTAFGQAKWGGMARQVAMGGGNAGTVIANPFIFEDPIFMLLNPAYQTMYKDYFWLNIGGGTLTGLTTGNNGYGHQFAGLNLALNNEWTVGGVFSYDPSAANLVRGLISGGAFPFPVPVITQRPAQAIPAIANVWEALVSFDGGAIDLGFGFTYGTSNTDFDTSGTVGGASFGANNEASARMLGFRGGTLLDLGGGHMLGVSAAVRLDKAKDIMNVTAPTATPGGEYSATGTEIQVEARLKWRVSNKVNFIPYGGFGTVTAEPKEDAPPGPPGTATPTTTSMKLTGTAFVFGLGGEYRTADAFVAGGASFAYGKMKVEANTGIGSATPGNVTAEASYTGLPVFNIGGEWWFLDWLAGRAGYFRSLGSTKIKISTSIGTTTTSSERNITTPLSVLQIGGLNPATFDGIVTLGVGFRFGNFSLDATVSEEALRRGFGLVGAQDNINSFGFLNASLNFQ